MAVAADAVAAAATHAFNMLKALTGIGKRVPQVLKYLFSPFC